MNLQSLAKRLLATATRIAGRAATDHLWPDQHQDLGELRLLLAESGTDLAALDAKANKQFQPPPLRDRLERVFDLLEALVRSYDQGHDPELVEAVMWALRHGDLAALYESENGLNLLAKTMSVTRAGESDLWYFGQMIGVLWWLRRLTHEEGPIAANTYKPSVTVEDVAAEEDNEGPAPEFHFGDPLDFKREDIGDD